ncbi:hypothetical protein ACF0H5_020710 [Mactra antiquata]
MVNTGRYGASTLEFKSCLNHCACSRQTARKTRPLLRDFSGTDHKNHAYFTSNNSNCNKNSEIKDKDCSYSSRDVTSVETRTYSYVSDLNAVTPDTYINECQISESLPYCELNLKPGSIQEKEYIANFTNHYISPRCGRILPGTSRLKFIVFCILISMLLLCKGCVCTCSDNLVSRARSEYLTFVNETNMAAVSGQCLTMTGSVIESICETRTDKRMRLLRHTDYYTPFCELPLYSLLSEEEKNTVQNCARDNGCARVLNHVSDIDTELSDMFCQFEDVLERIDCKDMFPNLGNCSLCKTAYKQWLCSVYNVHYIEGIPIKPCIEYCDRVSETCPFFRPHGETLIGEPGFLCKDSISLAEAAGSEYGPDGCCYKPCHLFPTGYCPELDISSNCTYKTNSASSLFSVQNQQMYILVVLSILCSYLSQTFPSNRNIGLT